MHWYAFQSKPRKERMLCEQLHLRQVEPFFPTIRVHSASARVLRLEPYFPGYVFGRVELARCGKSLLEWIPGAVRIVNVGGEPVPVPDALINTLRQHLQTVNADDAETARGLQAGDEVIIQGGVFAGYKAIFSARLPGRERVEVLLKMLEGSPVRVELPVEQIKLHKP